MFPHVITYYVPLFLAFNEAVIFFFLELSGITFELSTFESDVINLLYNCCFYDNDW